MCRQEIVVWLRMVPVGGEYPAPTSETSYRANTALINQVVPAIGAKLQPDGTWQRDEDKLAAGFTQTLPRLARMAGQRYVCPLNPGHGTDKAALYSVR